jgi:hypothetical protein
MRKIIRLTESDLTRIVRRVIMEQSQTSINPNEEIGGVSMLDKNRKDTRYAFYKSKLGTRNGKPVVIGISGGDETITNFVFYGYCGTKNQTAELYNKTTGEYETITGHNGNWERFCKQ